MYPSNDAVDHYGLFHHMEIWMDPQTVHRNMDPTPYGIIRVTGRPEISGSFLNLKPIFASEMKSSGTLGCPEIRKYDWFWLKKQKTEINTITTTYIHHTMPKFGSFPIDLQFTILFNFLYYHCWIRRMQKRSPKRTISIRFMLFYLRSTLRSAVMLISDGKYRYNKVSISIDTAGPVIDK